MIAILGAYILLTCIRSGLDLLNMRHLKSKGDLVPPEYLGTVDEALLRRTKEYTLETSNFSVAASLFSSLLVVIFFFGGILDWWNSMVLSFHLPSIVAGWLFLVSLYLAHEMIFIPFSLYHTFKIENRYGFNTTTARLWVSDFIKSLVISVIMLSLAAVAVLALVSYSPDHWWFWVWLFLLSFGLFVTYISPYVIEPLFNRFVPLENEELDRGIHRLALKAGMKIGAVLKMDQSKRSRHSNAYFAGIGKTKRIILFDTLLETMDHSETMAVLGHEMGHWKKRHILKSLVMMQSISFVGLYGGFHLMDSGILMTLFPIRHPSFSANLLIYGFLGSMAWFLIAPVLNLLSRHFERESDRYACDLTGNGHALVTALVKLSKENLSNLYPHPLYVAVHYSHPPILQRVGEIRAYCGTEKA